MNLYLNLLFLILHINFCFCAISRNLNATHEDHPGKCYWEKGEHVFSPGETFTPIGYCAKLLCNGPGYIETHTCGVEMMFECEKLPKDNTQPYPHCCTRFLCKFPNGTEYITTPQAKTTTIINTVTEDYAENH
ncbi:uncharacterized protein LOC129611449 [Condylostylus longicornis]|uniref:uncharacterized protein LOC129611449 n=1 Tax=Condylostylus longicornis TaxID=2530218 RepID=UPI00244E2BB8|nr:uncharacterized protein LOC129611449 [Condylostylus longicornis]